jgi:hypothetical protein
LDFIIKTDETPVRFHSGDITYNLAAQAAIQQASESGLLLLGRHLRGDWGDITAGQRQANRAAVAGDILRDAIVSRYLLPGGQVVVVTTRYVSEPSLRWTDLCLEDEVEADSPAEDGPPDEALWTVQLEFEAELEEDDPDFLLAEAEVLEFLEVEVL